MERGGCGFDADRVNDHCIIATGVVAVVNAAHGAKQSVFGVGLCSCSWCYNMQGRHCAGCCAKREDHKQIHICI